MIFTWMLLAALGSNCREYGVVNVNVGVLEINSLMDAGNMGLAWQNNKIYAIAWEVCDDSQWHVVDVMEINRLPQILPRCWMIVSSGGRMYRIWFITCHFTESFHLRAYDDAVWPASDYRRAVFRR